MMKISARALYDIIRRLPDVYSYPYDRIQIPYSEQISFHAEPTPTASFLILTFEKDYIHDDWLLINEVLHTEQTNLLG